MKLHSLNVACPTEASYQGKMIQTGIYKQPVSTRLWLGFEQLEGDGQADRVHHGGRDKAICVYWGDHYAYWESYLSCVLSFGAFGENFTVQGDGLTEDAVHIGDRFVIGEAIVEVSQPRQPCFKLSMRYGKPELVAEVQRTGFTGYYFRVLQEGVIEAGQSFRLLQKDALAISITEANRLMYADVADVASLERILSAQALSQSWRESFTRKLEKSRSRE